MQPSFEVVIDLTCVVVQLKELKYDLLVSGPRLVDAGVPSAHHYFP